MCHRQTGVGADGLLLLSPNNTLDFKMDYYNNDGSLNINGNAQEGINGYMYNFSEGSEGGDGGANINGTIITSTIRYEYRFL